MRACNPTPRDRSFVCHEPNQRAASSLNSADPLSVMISFIEQKGRAQALAMDYIVIRGSLDGTVSETLTSVAPSTQADLIERC